MIKKFTSQLKDEQQRVQELEQRVEESKILDGKLQAEGKEKEEAINKISSDLKSEQKRT